jgi:formylglycine-generating enzyme required for sulfatase activity
MKKFKFVLCLLIAAWSVNTALLASDDPFEDAANQAKAAASADDIFEAEAVGNFSGHFSGKNISEENVELFLKEEGGAYTGKMNYKGDKYTVTAKKEGDSLIGTIKNQENSLAFTLKSGGRDVYLFQRGSDIARLQKIPFPNIRTKREGNKMIVLKWEGDKITLQATEKSGNTYSGKLSLNGQIMPFSGTVNGWLLEGDIIMPNNKKKAFTLEPEGNGLVFQAGSFVEELTPDIQTSGIIIEPEQSQPVVAQPAPQPVTQPVTQPVAQPMAQSVQSAAAPAAGSITAQLGNGVGLELIAIQPGSFTMGSPASERHREGDEAQHQVTISQPFWIAKHEVTQGQYQALMGINPAEPKHGVGADCPVYNVTWNDAINFCAKLTEIERAAGRLPAGYEYTLPTEAQWEYACRAGTTTSYNNNKNITGEEISRGLGDVCWYEYNSRDRVHPVGQKQPNAWGLYDMHGNVSEWCWDWYAGYTAGAVTDPTGPNMGSERVKRGGSYDSDADDCRAAAREDEEPFDASDSGGFRVALSPVK